MQATVTVDRIARFTVQIRLITRLFKFGQQISPTVTIPNRVVDGIGKVKCNSNAEVKDDEKESLPRLHKDQSEKKVALPIEQQESN